eukprot:scaffold59238_cov27-Tisochrysis_lutea.AAC.6
MAPAHLRKALASGDTRWAIARRERAWVLRPAAANTDHAVRARRASRCCSALSAFSITSHRLASSIQRKSALQSSC